MNLVQGLVSEEKNRALTHTERRFWFSFSKRRSASFSYEKALTVLALPTISSTRVVSSPRASVCRRKSLKVLREMKRATKRDNGVMNTTTRVIRTFMESINPSVPIIVTSPVNSCAKPISRPSETFSISETSRLIISPCFVPSI